jgi:peptidoglycan hydrolase-like protein with peptidoglycan-binding domain
VRSVLKRISSVIGVAAVVVGLLAAGGGVAQAAVSTTQLQWDLAGLAYLPFSGIDGVYGTQTTAAVKAFQTDQCLTVDGVAGSQTDGALSSVIKVVQDTAGVSSDGLYGPATKSAVVSWQSANHLTADGAVGPITMAAMFITRNHQCGGPTSGQPGPGTSSAAQLQWDLAGLGYLPWSGIDGVIGPQTQGATMAFQTDRCLSVDGIAGSQTNGALSSVIKSVQQVAGTTADGAYGPNTRKAVASWQSAHNLSADGQAGPNTMSAMGVGRTVHCTAPPSGTPSPGASTTTQLQWDLAGLGYLPWSGIDGITGPHTAGATMAFQSDRCLTIDGIAGPQTNSALSSVVQSVQRVAGTTADGGYGPNTKAAVASWQSAHGLTADGQAGPQTMSAMGIKRALTCSTPPGSGTPAPGDVGKAIASVAAAQMNDSSRNHEIGGYNCNFYTTALGLSGTGAYCSNGWKSEEWCADFAKWVWTQAGVTVGGLTPAAASFYSYGRTHGTWHVSTPRVGDAVVFNLSSDGSYASHVGLVVGLGSGTFSMISGNTYNPSDGQDDAVKEVTLNDSGGGISGFTDPVTAAPASNNQSAFNYFVGKGLTKTQSAAIVGNFDQESSMSPTAKQYPSGAGRGIAQWSTGGRWDTYTNDNAVWYAGTQGQDVWTLTPQLGFTWYELGTYSNYGLAQLRASTDVYDAVVAFQNQFEGCGVCMTDNRVRYADQALAYYG